MKKILILLLLSFLLVGCGSNKQTNQEEEVQGETESTKEEGSEENVNTNTIDIYLDENKVSYKEIIFNQEYLNSVINNGRLLNETDSIEGIEISDVYKTEISELEEIKKDSIVNVYFPSEINGKPVLSIANTFALHAANVNFQDYTSIMHLPDSLLCYSPMVDNGLISVNDELRYCDSYSGYIDRIPSGLRYLDGDAYIKQDKLEINDNIVFGYANIYGEINEININSLSGFSDLIIGEESSEYGDTKIGTVNIKGDITDCSDLDSVHIIVCSDYLNIGENISLNGNQILYLDSNHHNEMIETGTIEIGTNVVNGRIECGKKVTKFIINDPSVSNVLCGTLNQGDSIVNKSGQEVDWKKIFTLQSDSDCNIVTGRLDFLHPHEGRSYVDVVEE